MVGTSTIVVFVTRDPALATALKEAVPATPVLTAASPAQLADVLLSRACGAMLIDVGPLGRGAGTVIAHLNRQFPDVPVVAVGAAQDEPGVAALVAAGSVFKFLGQPFVAGHTQSLIEAALRRHRELRPLARLPAARDAAAVEPRGERPQRAATAQAPAPPLADAIAQPDSRPPKAPPPNATLAAAAAVPAAAPGPGAASPRPAGAPPTQGTAAPAAAPAAPAAKPSSAPPKPDRPDRPDRPEKAAGEKPASGRKEGGREGGRGGAPKEAPPKEPSGPTPRTIAIGGAAIAVLAVVAWVVLREQPAPEHDAPNPVTTAPLQATAPGAQPIFRASDAEPATDELEAAAAAESAERARASRAREVARAADAPPAPPPLRKLVDTVPLYPPAARAAGTEGWVDVKFTINARGLPEDVRVSAARPRGTFEASAVEAVRNWRYVAPPAPLEATVRLRFAPH